MASTLPVESQKGADSLADALADPGGAVAVVSSPFAGRESVLDDAAEALDSPTRTRLAPGADPSSLPVFDDHPVVVDDCQHLYARRVGGFDPLDALLDRLTDASARAVTSWNRHSWNYLDAVRDLSDAFRHVFSIPALSIDQMQARIRAERDPMPTFEVPPGRRNSPVRTVAFSVPLPRRDPRPIRIPVVDVDYVDAWLRDRDRPDAEELFFQRLDRLSGGNAGVAAAIWEACVEAPAVTPDDLELSVESSVDPGDAAVAALGVVVAKGAVTRDELATVVRDVSLDRTLHALVEHEFVTVDDAVRLRPIGLPSALDSLARRRWLW